MKTTANYWKNLKNYLKTLRYFTLGILALFIVSCSNTKPTKSYYSENIDLSALKISMDNSLIDSSKIYPFLVRLNFTDTLLNQQLFEFYNNRNYRAAWFSDKEFSEKQRKQLINTIKRAEYEGLNSEDYFYLDILKTINTIHALQNIGVDNTSSKAELDVLLTKSYLKYASHIYQGTTNPADIDENWEYELKYKNYSNLLGNALEQNEIQSSFDVLYPKDSQYFKLRNALIELTTLKKITDWQIDEFATTLRLNDTSHYVFEVRKYLLATGDYQQKESEIPENLFVYDNDLEFAVKRFQARHGLKPDGVIGENTRSEMTKNIDFRIAQLKINMERLRWQPDEYGDKFIIVNLPEYTLRYYENDSLVEKMRVIIGKDENHTPLLNDTMIYVEFNPYWKVPYSIASKEILAKLKRDSSYLEKNNYQLISGYGVNSKIVDAKTIDWHKIDEENFPFQIRQAPGPTNALGLVKFIFPNSHAVYLHDTPSDYLFRNYERNLSHGCVRVEKPFQLAEIILKSINNLNEDTVKNIIQEGETQRIFLKNPLNVFFTYQTAWVEDNNNLNFRKDVYNLDEKQISLRNTFFITVNSLETEKPILSVSENHKEDPKLTYKVINKNHID